MPGTRPHYRRHRRLLATLALPLIVTACDDSPTNPPADTGATFTVDASSLEAWAFVALGSQTQVVEVTSPEQSAAWDLAFQQTAVMLNGGSNGPGGVLGYCICQNAGITDEEIQTLTPESELVHFEAVTAAQIPDASDGWQPDVVAENEWYRYNVTGENDHLIWPTFNVYLIQRGEEVFKIQLIGYYDANAEPRQITFRYAKLRG